MNRTIMRESVSESLHSPTIDRLETICCLAVHPMSVIVHYYSINLHV